LVSALSATGVEVSEAICGDEPDQLLGLLNGMEDEVDLVLTTGGISAGAFEVVRQALESEHSTFARVGMRPGSPHGHGRCCTFPAPRRGRSSPSTCSPDPCWSADRCAVGGRRESAPASDPPGMRRL